MLPCSHRSPDSELPPQLRRSESFVVPERSTDYQFPLQAPNRAGAVIMSEFSTAAYVMNSHVPVNPWSIFEFATAMDKVRTVVAGVLGWCYARVHGCASVCICMCIL